MAEERKQPRFSQFALAAARDTSAFDTKTVRPEDPSPRDGSVPETRAEQSEAGLPSDPARLVAVDGELKPVPKAPRASKPSAAAEPAAEEELVSFTVRLPASLYMRMRRSLGLREKLGELCVAAITRELDLRR
jgi:hypothetical protein